MAMVCPSRTRWLPLLTTAPSTTPARCSTRAAAAVRLTPPSMATMRSTRSPARAAGTVSVMAHPTSSRLTPGPEREEEQQASADDDGGIGQIEDRVPLQVDEVHDLPRQEPAAGAEHAVEDVAGGAPEHQTQGTGGADAGGAP